MYEEVEELERTLHSLDVLPRLCSERIVCHCSLLWTMQLDLWCPEEEEVSRVMGLFSVRHVADGCELDGGMPSRNSVSGIG